MAVIKSGYQTGTTVLTLSGLTTLANGSSTTSATVDNTSDQYLDVLVETIATTASGAVATGIVEIYGKGSIDNTDFDDDANDKWLGSIILGAAGVQTRKRVVSISAGFGGAMPPFYQIRIRNSSGAALTDGSVSVRGILAQTV